LRAHVITELIKWQALVAHGSMLLVEFGMRWFAPQLLEDYDPEKVVGWRKADVMEPDAMIYYGDKNLTVKVINEDVMRKGKPNGAKEWYDTTFGKISQVSRCMTCAIGLM
jgi:hypothetical protein